MLTLSEMPLEEQKRWVIFTSLNIQISPLNNRKITKLMPTINELSVTTYLSMPRTKTNLARKRWFWLACEHRRIFAGYLKLFRFLSAGMMQTKCKLDNAELFLKLCSEQRNWKQKALRRNKRTWKMAKWDFAWILTLKRRRQTHGWVQLKQKLRSPKAD